MGTKQSRVIEKPSPYQSMEQDWPWVWAIRDPEFLDWKQGLSNKEIEAEALRQRELPVKITENVYLGNAKIYLIVIQ